MAMCRGNHKPWPSGGFIKEIYKNKVIETLICNTQLVLVTSQFTLAQSYSNIHWW